MSNHARAHRLRWFVVAVVYVTAVLTAVNSCSRNRTVDKEPIIHFDSPRAQQPVGGQQEEEKPLLLDSGEAIDLLGGTGKGIAGTTESSSHANLESASDESSMAYYVMCNDCHGEHRMKVRTIIWDKKTGKRLHTNPGE